MSDQQVVVQRSGMGLCGWLLLLFIGLKLTGYITWSWWWVFSPIWLPVVSILGFVAVVFAVLGLFMLFFEVLEQLEKRRVK